jgi:hypothetical protein
VGHSVENVFEHPAIWNSSEVISLACPSWALLRVSKTRVEGSTCEFQGALEIHAHTKSDLFHFKCDSSLESRDSVRGDRSPEHRS